jgi:hypothetical protein
MTTLTHALQRQLPHTAINFHPRAQRAGVVALFAIAAASIPGTAAEALADAYLAVSVFVAGTITLVLAAEHPGAGHAERGGRAVAGVLNIEGPAVRREAEIRQNQPQTA